MNRLKAYSDFLLRPIFYVLALLSASYFVLLIEKIKPSDFGHYSKLFEKEIKINKQDNYPLNKKHGKLNTEELLFGKIAWRYFENNYE